MSVAPVLALRKAIVTHLRADAAVTATSVNTRIYGERTPNNPTFPFARYGASDALPGFDITAPLHVFSKDAFTDDLNAIAEAIGNSLDGKTLTLTGFGKAYLSWQGTRVISDGTEASEWHAIVTMGAMVPRDCATT
jgi:hypothetical protein